jgi:hypothetical protein
MPHLRNYFVVYASSFYIPLFNREHAVSITANPTLSIQIELRSKQYHLLCYLRETYFSHRRSSYPTLYLEQSRHTLSTTRPRYCFVRDPHCCYTNPSQTICQFNKGSDHLGRGCGLDDDEFHSQRSFLPFQGRLQIEG